MSKFVKCGPDLTVNRDEVAAVSWDRGQYAYGPRDSKLIITLANGIQHSVVHNPHHLGGVDCYKIEREIVAND